MDFCLATALAFCLVGPIIQDDLWTQQSVASHPPFILRHDQRLLPAGRSYFCNDHTGIQNPRISHIKSLKKTTPNFHRNNPISIVRKCPIVPPSFSASKVAQRTRRMSKAAPAPLKTSGAQIKSAWSNGPPRDTSASSTRATTASPGRRAAPATCR